MSNSTNESKSEWTSKDPNASGGRFLLVLAWIFFSLNFVIELNTFIWLWNDPTFVPGTAKMNSAISIGTGLAQVMHVIAFVPVGIVFLAAALITRNRLKTGRLKKIIILLVAGILLMPGTLSVGLAWLVGPSPIASEGKQNAVDSEAALGLIRAQGPVDGFDMIDEYWPGEPDTTWRTGVYNLTSPAIEQTCTNVLDYAKTKGATEVRQLPDGPIVRLANREQAINQCVSTMNTYPHQKRHKYELASQSLAFSGTSNTQPQVPIVLRLTLIKYGYLWEKPDTWGYELIVASRFAEQ